LKKSLLIFLILKHYLDHDIFRYFEINLLFIFEIRQKNTFKIQNNLKKLNSKNMKFNFRNN
jgi:hypothetical protein